MDCCLPADFFLVDDIRRAQDGDVVLGADAHVYLEPPAFTSGLRDWRTASKPRGYHPQRKPREACDGEWAPL